MERLKGGIFITPKEIQQLSGISHNRAQREHQTIRDALGKTSNRLTVREYCQYHQLNLDEVIDYINSIR